MGSKTWDVGSDYRIRLVFQSDDCNMLLLESLANSVNPARHIETYEDKEFAIKQAELFARNIQIALEEGFHLLESFTHGDGRRIDYSHALDMDRTAVNFRELLLAGK